MPLPTEILEQLPEDLRGNESLNQFNTVEALAKSYVETKAMQGTSIRIPGPDAGPEAMTEYVNKLINTDANLMLKPKWDDPEQSQDFWKTMGKPESADKYILPDGIELPEGVETEMREMAFISNNTQDQFHKSVAGMAERYKATLEANSEQTSADVSGLKAKWGVTYEDRMAAAREINKDIYGERVFENLNTAEIEGLYSTHERLTGKGPQVATQIETGSRGMTPMEAEEQAQEILVRITDRESGLSPEETRRLAKKRIQILQDNVPKYAINQ
jgi:hypothetical protein